MSCFYDMQQPAVCRLALAVNAKLNLSIGNEGEEVVETEERNLEWSLELKVSLIELEEEARVLGKGQMKRLKEMWDEKHPDFRIIA